MGRPATPCRLGAKRVRSVRCRGGNMKYRALKLDTGNYAWGSETITKKVRILDVVYNATSNELVRTKTLLKNTIVQLLGLKDHVLLDVSQDRRPPLHAVLPEEVWRGPGKEEEGRCRCELASGYNL